MRSPTTVRSACPYVDGSNAVTKPARPCHSERANEVGLHQGSVQQAALRCPPGTPACTLVDLAPPPPRASSHPQLLFGTQALRSTRTHAHTQTNTHSKIYIHQDAPSAALSHKSRFCAMSQLPTADVTHDSSIFWTASCAVLAAACLSIAHHSNATRPPGQSGSVNGRDTLGPACVCDSCTRTFSRGVAAVSAMSWRSSCVSGVCSQPRSMVTKTSAPDASSASASQNYTLDGTPKVQHSTAQHSIINEHQRILEHSPPWHTQTWVCGSL